jgi:catalase
MPVFFVRDGMKFPDMVHALKPNPVNHIQVRSFFLSVFSPFLPFLEGRIGK